MAAAPREYELVLMLDPGQDEPARESLAQETRGRIEAEGTLKHENNWGLRKMAYEIGNSNEADYRWFRFEAPTELLDGLNHNLKITDGVLRFRIFKVDPDSPVLVPPAGAAPTGPPRDRDRGERAPQDAPPAAPAEDAEAPAEAEAPSEAEAPAADAEAPAQAEAPAEDAEAPEASSEPAE